MRRLIYKIRYQGYFLDQPYDITSDHEFLSDLQNFSVTHDHDNELSNENHLSSTRVYGNIQDIMSVNPKILHLVFILHLVCNLFIS